ncbi:hypothetical protein [Fulvivirga ligni]|uniref:hypothetical protein n=1 Tax=Fulvivirga ligni TaxID=2904246 RepID=UPI001F43C715|nr:hypothetical protein [Fulvivirga ligni]UII22511.1 hypothetical protein LVD16_04620 [Fulvivirga ligni]
MRKFNSLLMLFAGLSFILASCGDDEAPAPENEEEVINEVTLTFTPTQGGETVTATFYDPDGDGTQAGETDEIVLAANTEYEMSISLKNTVGDEDEDITEEVEEESDAHMFFFGWDLGLFGNPQGDGNIGAGQRNDPMNYEDEDNNGLPIGLTTKWTTSDAVSGTFRTVLKHQPGLKSSTTTTADGDTDVDLTWDITIE